MDTTSRDTASPNASPEGREFQPRDLVRHMWSRKWLVIAVAVVAFAVTWAVAASRRGTTYESRATVLVQTLPRLSAEDRTPMGYNPPAFRSMFLADATLDAVRRARDASAPIEAWRGRFSAFSSTEVDNTVATEYTPTVELRARAGSAEEAVALMNAWVDAILAQYGDLYGQEGRAVLRRATARAAELREQYAATVAQEEEHRLRHRSAVARAESIGRLLDGPLPASREFLSDTLAPYGFTAGAVAEMGEREQSGDDTPSLSLTRLLGELRDKEPEVQVEGLKGAQESALTEAASAAGGLAAASAERLQLEQALRVNASAAAQAEARFPVEEAGAVEPGTLRILAPTVEPGGTRGRAPHITALIVAFLALVLTKTLFAAEAYLRFSLAERD